MQRIGAGQRGRQWSGHWLNVQGNPLSRGLYLQVSKRKRVFLKNNMTQHINLTGERIKTALTFMLGATTYKNTLKRPMGKFVGCIGTIVRKTETAKSTEVRVGSRALVKN